MAVKFLQDIELTAKLLDENGLSGSAGQILSATTTGTEWIDAITAYTENVTASTDNNKLGIVVATTGSGNVTKEVGLDITGRTGTVILGMQDTDQLLIYDNSSATNLKVSLGLLNSYIKYTDSSLNIERSKHFSLTDVTTGITRTVASGYTTFELTIDTWFPYYFDPYAFMIQVVDVSSTQSNLGQIVGAEIDLNTGTTDKVTIKFRGTVANDDYKVNIHYTGDFVIPQ